MEMFGGRLGFALGVAGIAALFAGLLLFLAPIRLRLALTWEERERRLLGEADVVLALGIVRRSLRFRLAPPEPLCNLVSPRPGGSPVPSDDHRTPDPEPFVGEHTLRTSDEEGKPASAEGVMQTERGRYSLAEVGERVRAVLHGRREYPAAYARLRRALRHGRIERLSVRLAVGTGDAVTTAYLVGLLWGILGVLVGWASSYVPLSHRPALSIRPVFSRAGLTGEAEGIVQIPPVHAIRAALFFYQMYRKGRDGG
ncbi:hypothetical protein C7438_1690 [Brockia lithotrophica]|uniref:DUF2953 family protein n=2 Tax=Brockia lithotrophica TaxID=933949 RepID=A0A660L010_9BACL|nr:hypothetical protein C7438_1690 [Brockia lithotrophica]